MTKLRERSADAAMPEEPKASDLPGNFTGHRPIALHFTLAPADVAECEARLDRLSGIEAKRELWRAIYLDTPDHEIAALGLGFGVQRALDKRAGWRRFTMPLSAATPPSARRRLSHCLRRAVAIEAVASVQTQRSLWSVSAVDMQVQIRLDRSTVLVDGAEDLVASLALACEVPNATFFRLVTDISQSAGLRLSAESDLVRVFRRRGDLPSHVLAFAPKLDVEMDAAAAFRAIAAACFDHFLLNETAIRASDDHESVHQCRVALRRLSACLRFFEPFTTGSDYESLRNDLKELRGHLRAARDLDVMIGDVLVPALANEPPAGGRQLLQTIEARRDKAHANLVAKLREPSCASLLLRVVLWIEAGEWARNADRNSAKRRATPITVFAGRRFARMHRRFVARCADLEHMDQEARHKVRIRAKNLRYDAEFFMNLAQGRRARKRLAQYIQVVKKLQTVLGDWNDVLMASRFLTSFGEDKADAAADRQVLVKRRKAAPLAAARALAQQLSAASKADFMAKSMNACTALGKVKPFWTKLG